MEFERCPCARWAAPSAAARRRQLGRGNCRVGFAPSATPQLWHLPSGQAAAQAQECFPRVSSPLPCPSWPGATPPQLSGLAPAPSSGRSTNAARREFRWNVCRTPSCCFGNYGRPAPCATWRSAQGPAASALRLGLCPTYPARAPRTRLLPASEPTRFHQPAIWPACSAPGSLGIDSIANGSHSQ